MSYSKRQKHAIIAEKRTLRTLAGLRSGQRARLRVAVLRGEDDFAASIKAECSQAEAMATRRRLTTLGLVPPEPVATRRRQKKPDPRQLPLL